MCTRKALHVPDSFVFQGRVWHVQRVKGLARWETGCRGLLEPDHRLMSLDDDLCRLDLEQTYVHEILHAIWPPKLCSDTMEERVICGLEGPLHEALVTGILRRVDEAATDASCVGEAKRT